MHGIGSWRDGEREYRETVAVYTIDAEDSDDIHLIEVAQMLATYCEQEAVYVTRQPIDTHLVVKPSLSSSPESG